MHLFLTSVLSFLAHDHASAAALLTCRHHNFHSSIIPEFLSSEERVRKFCAARQQNQLYVSRDSAYTNLYNLFVRTPLMQFSPSLVLRLKDCAKSILKPLLKTKYFTRTLQRCTICLGVEITNEFLRGLSKVRSLTKLDLGESEVEKEELEIIINSFPSIETLIIQNAGLIKIVDPSEPAIQISSPSPPVTKTLRSLTLKYVDPLIAIQFVPHFPNLRKLVISNGSPIGNQLDLCPLSSSLPLLKDVYLGQFTLKNAESLQNLVHLSSLQFVFCQMPGSLSFLTKENSLPELRTFCIVGSLGSSSSAFASLAYAPNLHVLKLHCSKFNNNCLQYLENMIHLRDLDLGCSGIIGDSRSLKTLMQNLFQLEDLDLGQCNMGNQGAIAGALYSTHSRLRVLNLDHCNLVDDDLNGISKLKNTLEVLDLSDNSRLTTEALVHCRDLARLKKLNVSRCHGIDDLSPLKDCLCLEDLNGMLCSGLVDDSFKVFSEEPNSFPNLRALNMSVCVNVTEKLLEHLSKNHHLVHRLKYLSVIGGIGGTLSSSPTARNNIFRLQGLQVLSGVLEYADSSTRNTLERELLRNLKNVEKLT